MIIIIGGAIISYICSAIFIGLGFHKMFVYENPEYSFMGDPVNVYVGGDAYNYIINANYATAYFALAIFCAVVGMTFIVWSLIVSNNKDDKINRDTKSPSDTVKTNGKDTETDKVSW